jgi:hypothetical protein
MLNLYIAQNKKRNTSLGIDGFAVYRALYQCWNYHKGDTSMHNPRFSVTKEVTPFIQTIDQIMKTIGECWYPNELVKWENNRNLLNDAITNGTLKQLKITENHCPNPEIVWLGSSLSNSSVDNSFANLLYFLKYDKDWFRLNYIGANGNSERLDDEDSVRLGYRLIPFAQH